MARVCDLTGKRRSTGRNVSHSNRRTLRSFLPNLFTKTFIDPRTGEKFRAKVSASAIKTLTKNPAKILELAKKLVKLG
jgi:large subunit ribosomal protein L28